MFSQEGSHATGNAIPFKITGARNYLENVTARNLSTLGVLDASKRDLVINSVDGENYFKNCCFGTDTYDGSANAANYVLEFNGAVETARNIFDDCIFLGSGSSGACFILATTVSCMSSFQLFKNCKFWNNDHGSMNAMTQAFNIAGACGGHLIFENPLIYGASALETVDSNMVIGSNAFAAATTGRLVVLTG
jgi:hypothetical protein